MTASDRQRQDECRDRLRKMVKPGDTVYTVLRHVSRSGMQRSIGVLIMTKGEPHDWSGLVARAIGSRWDDKRGGVIMGGCGTDMGFEVVYNLGHALWPGGVTCIGDGCHSNDHSNGDRDYTPHTHKDPGYALRRVWL